MIPRAQGGEDDVAKQPGPPRFDQATIGERMREAREKRGWSRTKLIKESGLAMQEDTLRKKENGDNPFYFHELTAFCDALEAPSLFPIMPWGEARLADKLLGLARDQEPSK
jgi:transcriptional regulator with XRE-family HTH domain